VTELSDEIKRFYIFNAIYITNFLLFLKLSKYMQMFKNSTTK